MKVKKAEFAQKLELAVAILFLHEVKEVCARRCCAAKNHSAMVEYVDAQLIKLKNSPLVCNF